MRHSIVGWKHLVLPQRFQSHIVNQLRKWHLYLMQSTGGTDAVSVYLDVGSVEFASEYENEPMSEMSGRAFRILELSYRGGTIDRMESVPILALVLASRAFRVYAAESVIIPLANVECLILRRWLNACIGCCPGGRTTSTWVRYPLAYKAVDAHTRKQLRQWLCRNLMVRSDKLCAILRFQTLRIVWFGSPCVQG